MIKLPEPVSLLRCHTAQEAYHYTEAQLKQAVRDFGEHLAKHFGAMTGREMFGGEIEDEIRALIKEIPE